MRRIMPSKELVGSEKLIAMSKMKNGLLVTICGQLVI